MDGIRPTWTAHEAALLLWLRLRPPLSECLGVPEPLRLQAVDLQEAPDCPPELAACSSNCLANLAPILEQQGQLRASGSGWQLPATHATSVEACWKLVPAFHGRWGALWDLRSLEESLPAMFTEAEARRALQAREAACQDSPFHKSRRAPSPGTDQRIRALAVEGWIAGAPDRCMLHQAARDALTLFRIVIGPRVTLPPGALERMRPIQPGRR